MKFWRKYAFSSLLLHILDSHAVPLSEKQIAEHLVQIYVRNAFNKNELEARMLFYTFQQDPVALCKVTNDFDLLAKFREIEESNRNTDQVNLIFDIVNAGKNVFLTECLADLLTSALKERSFLPPVATKPLTLKESKAQAEEKICRLLTQHFEHLSAANHFSADIENGTLKEKVYSDLAIVFSKVKPFQDQFFKLPHQTKEEHAIWMNTYQAFCSMLSKDIQMQDFGKGLFQRFSFATSLIRQKNPDVDSLSNDLMHLNLAPSSSAYLKSLCMTEIPQTQVFDLLFRSSSEEKNGKISIPQEIDSARKSLESVILSGLIPSEILKKNRCILGYEEIKKIGIWAYDQLKCLKKTLNPLHTDSLEVIEGVISKVQTQISALEKIEDSYCLMGFLSILKREKVFLEIAPYLQEKSLPLFEEYKAHQQHKHLMTREQRYFLLHEIWIRMILSRSDTYFTLILVPALSQELELIGEYGEKNSFAQKTILDPQVINKHLDWWERIEHVFQNMLHAHKEDKPIIEKVLKFLEKRNKKEKNQNKKNLIEHTKYLFLPKLKNLYEQTNKNGAAPVKEALRILILNTEGVLITEEAI
jgi:hypothetical protein